MDLLLSKPSRILEGLSDILTREIWVVFQYFLLGCSVGELTDNHRNGNSHSADAGAASQDFGIKRYSFEHRESLLGAVSLLRLFYRMNTLETERYLAKLMQTH